MPTGLTLVQQPLLIESVAEYHYVRIQLGISLLEFRSEGLS